MSSIYLYIIYISRSWFKGSGAEAGNGSISGTSILLCHFYRYAIVHTNHLFCEEERVQRWPSFSLSSSTGGENGCVPKGFNQKHAGCRETSGVFCCERGSGLWVQGSGVWWRLRRKYLWGDARRSVDRRFSSYRQPSPRGEGAPKGRIGHWRYERQMRKTEKCVAHVWKA